MLVKKFSWTVNSCCKNCILVESSPLKSDGSLVWIKTGVSEKRKKSFNGTKNWKKTVKQVVRSPGLKLAMICFIKLVLPVPDSADNQNSLLWCEIFGDRINMCGAKCKKTYQWQRQIV